MPIVCFVQEIVFVDVEYTLRLNVHLEILFQKFRNKYIILKFTQSYGLEKLNQIVFSNIHVLKDNKFLNKYPIKSYVSKHVLHYMI